MATVQPKSDAMKRAIRWISEKRSENPKKSDMILADEAAIQFDLSPEESEFLQRFVKESAKG